MSGTGMFRSGCFGQWEYCSCEPMSTARVDPQKTGAAEEQSFHQRESSTFRPEDYYPHRLSQVDSTDGLLSLSQGSSRASCNTDGAVEVLNNFGSRHAQILNDDEEEEGEEEEEETDAGSSGKLVEHLFKELKGINKIQEEISDLRQHLTSVHGSVDEVSCCVDAFLCEIEELYSGASAVPLPGPSPQTGHARRGSLGRQNAVTSPYEGCLPSGTIPKYRHVSQVAQPLMEQTNKKPNLWTEELQSCCTTLENHMGFGLSTTSLSSCLSPATSYLSEADAWPLFDGGWSEDDVDSEELQIRPDLLNRWATIKAKDCSQGLEKSSKGLDWSLFMPFGATTFDSASPMDCGFPRVAQEVANCRFRQSPNFPPLGSSGYSTLNVSLDQCCGGQSRSDVMLSDSVKPDGDCSSWRNVALLGSTHSLGRDWMESSSSTGDDGLDQLTETDPADADLMTGARFDTTTFNKAMLTFRSALKGALKKLEAPEPLDNVAQEFRPAAMVSMPVQESMKELNEKLADLKVCSLTADHVPSSISQGSPPEPPDLLVTSCSTIGTPKQEEESTSECEPSSAQPNTNSVRLSPISENQALDHSSPKQPCDAGHRERITKFQQILREKRQMRQRLSRTPQDSQGSQSSQCSQCSQSSQTSQCPDEFISGIDQIVV